MIFTPLVWCAAAATEPARPSVTRRAPDAASAAVTTLELGSMFVAGAEGLVPSPALVAASGRRVRLVGFMARMEEPPRGAFWLTPRPVSCDESGDGASDLPPESVRVVVHSARSRVIAPMAGPVEVTGVLEVGNQVDEDGRTSMVRLVLMDSKPAPRLRPVRRGGTPR